MSKLNWKRLHTDRVDQSHRHSSPSPGAATSGSNRLRGAIVRARTSEDPALRRLRLHAINAHQRERERWGWDGLTPFEREGRRERYALEERKRREVRLWKRKHGSGAARRSR